MPKIQLLEIAAHYCDCDCAYVLEDLVDKSDWQEVSDEDLDLLRRFVATNYEYKLLIQRSERIPLCVENVLSKYKKDLESEKKRKKKAAEAAAKRNKTIQAKKEAKEKAKFEELKKKFGTS